MNLSIRFDADGDSSFQVLWGDGERVFCRGWRLDHDGQRQAVLAVRLAAEHPTPASLDRLAHEYGLKDELDPAWAARPLELLTDAGRPMLVLEDPGGEPLEGLLGAPMEVGRFLRLAVAIAAALTQLHRRGLVHKDIKPAHILANATAGEAKLTGFGLTSRLPRERQTPEPPETIAGTLAYMAPEQTGRMNRSIDTRSDLYALGVTLYQMLTGTLPFTAADPMEWVHCHIARRPVPPAERLPDLPAAVSAIIMKLLAKTAEERYQTAGGVERDLRRCLAQWEARRRIDDFPLGEHDTPDRLLIPEKLYGREREVESLRAAFDRIVKFGKPELVLVSGYAGIGKSAVVHELHNALVPPRGLFASGKFDQYKRDIPYSTLSQAFQGLIRGLLASSEADLAPWRDALLEALGPNGRLMVDLVPELKLIIGDQPPVPELPPQQSQSRFQLVFRRFLGVFARPEHPLALFLDDLQWLDTATLDLLEDWLTQPDVRHLLLIGAYRDNEIAATHPLRRKLEAILKAGALVQEIVLAPLGLGDVGRLIADALHGAREGAKPLARLVYEKTAGNPFFTIQFLTTLAEEGLLAFDHGEARWSWDLERIEAKGFTDNVVELMLGKLGRLPEATQTALRQLACLGNRAAIATLAMVRGGSEGALDAALWEAVRAGLLFRQVGIYWFLHDRVQEAAYALIPEGERAAEHLRIGRQLAAGTPPDAVEESVFEIVSQLNRGAALITAAEEREQLAGLNLLAGRRAKASTAYASALTYLTTGVALLPDNAWERRPALAFALALHRAECEFLTGALMEAEARLAELASRAASLPDLATVTRLRVDLVMALGQSDRAVAVGLDYLRRIGIVWSAHPTQEEVRQEYARIWRQLGDRPIEALLNLPRMADPVACGTMDVLTALVSPALFTDENLRCLVIGRMGNLSLEHGNSDASCYAYTAVGTVLGPYFGDYKAGFRFGQLGLDLVEQRGMDRLKARVYLAFGNLASPSMRQVRMGRPLARHAFDTALQAGDLTYAAFSCNGLITQLLASGDPLAEVQREAEVGLDFARQARFGLVVNLITAQLQLIRTLRGLTPTFGRFDDAGCDEERFEAHVEADPHLAIAACLYWIRKLQARVLADDHTTAAAVATKAERLLWMSPSIFERAEYHFYAALVLAALCDATSTPESTLYRKALASHHRQLQEWADNCPENFENRAALVGAEIARIEDRDVDAMRLYEQAIRSARINGFVHNEAIAYERASAFYRARGFDQIATLYLRNARYCYLRWGADGKVRQLDESYPYLREDGPTPSPTRTIGAPVEYLDLKTVITVSQAVSGEIVLEKLLETLMRTALAQAGAERGLLILSRGAEPRIAAEATTRGDTVVVNLRDEPVAPAALPESVLHYVLRTRESVILDDAAVQPPFAADPYIRQRQARSILCLPLIHQAKLIGVLYLENNLAPRVFAPARLAVLKLLASQAAIALENARLYRDLAERESKIQRLVDANIIGVVISEPEGQVIEANDAFLDMLGYTREDLAAGPLRWTDLTLAEWRAASQRAVAQIGTTGACEVFEKEYVRKDGSRVPVLIGAAALEGTGETVAFVLDLTERKRAENELRANEAKMERAQRVAHFGWWERDFTTNDVSLSDEACRIFGVQPVDLPEWHGRWLSLIHPEDRPRADEAAAAALLRGGPRYDVEYRVIRPDGIERIIHSQGDVTWDDSGRPLRQFGVMQDITELRAVENELRESEERFRTFVDHATDAFLLLGEDWTVLDVNRQACAGLGYSSEELIGRHKSDFDVSLDDTSIQRLKQRMIAGEAITFETRHQRKDGTSFPVEVRVGQFEQGGPRYLCSVRDITERKRAQGEHERLHQLEADLAHVNRMSIMGELAASLAHEILHPIATARNNARAGMRFLERSPPNLAEVQDALSCIVRDADRAKDIVGRMRDHIKKAPPRREAFDLNEAVHEVIATVRSAIDQKRVSVRTRLVDGLDPVWADRVQLQQVVMNLVLNAVEAMSSVEEAARELSITTKQVRPDQILVAVQDSGPGLDPEHLEQVFAPFYTTKTSGIGMGLSICRSIIAAHGGRLWAEANHPRGATFQFTLPAGLDDS